MPEPMRITVGVTGGIAAYKAAELVRQLQQRGHTVRVVLTRSAEEFIRPLTFSALTGHKVYTTLWDDDQTATSSSGAPFTAQPYRDASGNESLSLAASGEPISSIEHIALAQWTQLLIVAPCTANTLAKFAHGLADDFLSTLYLATTAPTLIAPAMNVNMWNHPATQQNLTTLRNRGVHLVEPGSGYLACGMEGGGRLADPAEIAAAADRLLTRSRDLAGETILVTAGGTREPLDPVRFLGNRSSGRMGYAIAAAAADRGARVILITAPTALTAPANVELIPVTTAAQMRTAVLDRLPEATMVFKAAAVADFRPASAATTKIRRSGPLTLTLEPTEDIAAEAAARKLPGTLLIAFAAETPLSSESLLEAARAKLLRKNVDAIVANDVAREGLGFDSDRNAATLLTRDAIIDLGESTKLDLAGRLLDEALKLQPHRARAATL